jgi:plasmid maintenance system antidote protein VapI
MNNNLKYDRVILLRIGLALKRAWDSLRPRREEPLGIPVSLGKVLSDALARKGMTVEEVERKAGLEPGDLAPLIKGTSKLTPELTLKLEPVIGGLAESLYFFQVASDYYERNGEWPASPSPETARKIRAQLGR